MGNRVVQIAPGDLHVAFLLEDGTVKTCGYNYNGQLGLGHTNDVSVLSLVPDLVDVKSLHATTNKTFYILKDHRLKVCGAPTGALYAENSESDHTVPSLSVMENIDAIANYSGSTFCISKNGEIFACGINNYGQLGIGNLENQSTPTINSNVENVHGIYVSHDTTVFILNDGTVKACGYNYYSLFGSGLSGRKITIPTEVLGVENIKQVAFGELFVALLLENGTVKVCGKIQQGALEYNEITLIAGFENVKQISCGANYIIALLENGQVKGYGYGGYGGIGTGSVDTVRTPTLVSDIDNVVQVACGARSTYFLLSDGKVMACGQNSRGELGLGDTVQRNTPTVIDALTPTAPEPEPEPEPGVDAKEITVRVHQKTADGYRHIRFEGGGTAVVSKQYQQVTKLGVTAPKTEDIEIAATEDFCLSPVEVLKFVQNEQDKVVSVCTFDNSDAGDFLIDGQSAAESEAFVFDGVMKPNTSFTIAFTEPKTLDDGMICESAEIDFAAYKKVEGIEVA